MSKLYYAAYSLPAMSLLSGDADTNMARAEAKEVAYFDSLSNALSFVSRESMKKALPATTVPLGPNLDESFKIPGVGVIYDVWLSPEQAASLQQPDTRDSFRGIKMKGPMMGEVHSVGFVLEQDDFTAQPQDVVDAQNLRAALSARHTSFQMMDDVLENTSLEVRKKSSPQTMFYESLRMTFGPNSPIRNDFHAPYPQDQKFWDIYKMLCDEHAGLQYFESFGLLYSKYRDAYARNMIGTNRNVDASTTQAKIEVLNKIINIAENTNDTRMEGILKDEAKSAEEKALEAEYEEITESK